MLEILNGISSKNIFYHESDFCLLLGDCTELLKSFKEESVDMIFADPPYFLSGGGITCSSGRMVCVDKGEWDKSRDITEIHKFNKKWLGECRKVLKKDGTIWISGTYHNIYSVGITLQELGFKILNNIVWYKRNAPPNLSCRYFTHSNETIIWAKKSEKSKHYFNYNLMKEINSGKQMRDVWNLEDIWDIPVVSKKEKKHGKYPAQKPMELLRRIILASTKEGQVILDPFNGSGTTGIIAKELNRKYIGIELEKDYLDLTLKRYNDI